MIFDQVQTDGIMNYLNFTEEHHVWSTNYDIVNLCANGWRKVYTSHEIALHTGQIQCEVLTTLPFCFSWIKNFLGQQSKI